MSTTIICLEFSHKCNKTAGLPGHVADFVLPSFTRPSEIKDSTTADADDLDIPVNFATSDLERI